MPAPKLLDTHALTSADIRDIFDQAHAYEEYFKRSKRFFAADSGLLRGHVAVGLFFENSTRTLTSFQIAASRLAISFVNLDLATSSLAKGETVEDTVYNVLAMQPDVLVVRHGSHPALEAILKSADCPIVSGGNANLAHPTQGLLDAWTIQKEKGRVAGQKVLIVGDIQHSRVARSNVDILHKLGAEVGICGPSYFLPKDRSEFANVRVFENLDEALAWPTVFMGLRVQSERHTPADFELSDYLDAFGLTAKRLSSLAEDSLIMHPGPINFGVEFADVVSSDPRFKVLSQVQNGVYIRAAIFDRLLRRGKNV